MECLMEQEEYAEQDIDHGEEALMDATEKYSYACQNYFFRLQNILDHQINEDDLLYRDRESCLRSPHGRGRPPSDGCAAEERKGL